MLKSEKKIALVELMKTVCNVFEISAGKISNLLDKWDVCAGAPAYTVGGIYTSWGWTDWTAGFFLGMPLLFYDYSGERNFLLTAKTKIFNTMSPRLTHVGTHDHGFNVVSTYGTLLRLMREGRMEYEEFERNYVELALKVSGAVQALRWMSLSESLGYIYSFCGKHSLFVDTIRSLRSLALAYQLGHVLITDGDKKVNLLGRLLQHAESTALYNVYFGTGRDLYDVRGRVSQEAIFDIESKTFRCPSTQQGYSPYSTWMRGLAWALCGFAEELEFLQGITSPELLEWGGKEKILDRFVQVAEATADFYIANTPTDGIPYWDTGAPGLVKIGNFLDCPADPFNDFEPVDSSAAAIAAQGLVRLGTYLLGRRNEKGEDYLRAGLTIARNIFSEPYLSTDMNHEGLLLHSVYHRPKGWGYMRPGEKPPVGESSMWGDYHALELALLIYRISAGKTYLCFFHRNDV